MSRKTIHDLMPEIAGRWSPRAFDPEPLAEDDIQALLEAASLAPSSSNEQPWRFLLAQKTADLDKMRLVLSEKNRRWAGKAPLLILIAAKKTFSHNNKPNHWHMFDTGTAWGLLSLEAQHRGLVTHAMGGFDRDLAREQFAIDDEYEIITVVAVGRYGNKNELPEDLQARERPNDRMPIEDIQL